MDRLTKKDYKDWTNTAGYYSAKDAQKITDMERKLGALEDLMEKYGIESVEELDATLEDDQFAKDSFIKLLEDHRKWEINCNTWKRACELACESMAEEHVSHSTEYFTPSNAVEERKNLLLNDFYIQAQKERKDEN